MIQCFEYLLIVQRTYFWAAHYNDIHSRQHILINPEAFSEQTFNSMPVHRICGTLF
jgi:hypothetical protein